ncbi:hypothetical protein [Rugamonas aquatica]|uniref:Uncharacterized protein n=1 Tax=Rugamonas aquatica TaxID=2743357 RepID=A0A6A7MV97_9BURK|nr:hypothetical protein [Rugamonas aquatica]MQA37046.1 hypothetical protein [Rugamonas aquatica]
MANWGVIEPAELPQTRLRLDFGLRAAILAFNDWAVPGLGGASFVRQLSWACLGISFAEEFEQPAMAAKIAEAMEAFAGWIAVKRESKLYEKDQRIQGRRKFAQVNQLSFGAVTDAGAYVTVPFRRAATAALPGLGFCVQAEFRFNALQLSEPGRLLARAALDHSQGGDRMRRLISNPNEALTKVTEEIKRLLLPGMASPSEISIVKDQLMQDARRAQLLTLFAASGFDIAELQTSEGQLTLLRQMTDDVHRSQLDACFAFERLRAAALKAAQNLTNACKTTRQSWDDLTAAASVQADFTHLESCCRTLEAKLASLPDVPAEVLTFCAEQSGGTTLEKRIRALAQRVPTVLYVYAYGLERVPGASSNLLAAVADDSTEGETLQESGTIPRPLLRLQRLHHDILAGAHHAA